MTDDDRPLCPEVHPRSGQRCAKRAHTHGLHLLLNPWAFYSVTWEPVPLAEALTTEAIPSSARAMTTRIPTPTPIEVSEPEPPARIGTSGIIFAVPIDYTGSSCPRCWNMHMVAHEGRERCTDCGATTP